MAKTSTVLEKHGWTIVSEIGKGGQATVHEVRKRGEPDTGPTYACKLLRTDEGTQAYERFHREIESLQKLNDPGIVKVVDHKSDEDEGVHFYVMEYIKGAVSLKKIVGTPKNPFHQNALEAVSLYIDLLQALVACEQQKIVHRDLSLGNVLITPGARRAKLIDFGCCHLQDGRCVTLTDEAVGTPHYRAPECDGYSASPPTVQADLYSAGKILWSVVTNQKSFDREKPVFNNLCLSKKLPEHHMTWHFHDIFARTIRHDPSSRYPSAAVALQDAKRIRDLVVRGFPPLERFADETCPMCGVGRYAKPNQFHLQTLIGSNELKPNQPDEEIAQEIGVMDLGQGIYHADVCLNCGFMPPFIKGIPKRILKLRMSLE